MECKYRQHFPGVTHCQLIDTGFPDAESPCGVCELHWIDSKPPAPGSLPEILKDVADGKLLVFVAAPATPLTPIQKIRNAAKAFAAFVRSGGQLLDAPTVAARLAVCDGCDKRGTFLRVSICTACGCNLRMKASLPTQNCPRGLWPGDPVRRPCGSPCGG